MVKEIRFLKMNGAGNEIIVADMQGREGYISPKEVISLRQKIHFDQMMIIYDKKSAQSLNYIVIMNADGSCSGACGNGMRCVASILSRQSGLKEFYLETNTKILHARIHPDSLISIDMGQPEYNINDSLLHKKQGKEEWVPLKTDRGVVVECDSPCLVSLGNPHAVFWITVDPESCRLDDFGSKTEKSSLFLEPLNISIAKATSKKTISMRTWERGAGLTASCGSAACAATVCGAERGLTERKTIVHMRGGDLLIEWREDNHIIMTGPTEEEFSGIFCTEKQNILPDKPEGKFL